MTKPLIVDYYTDILCVWAWIAQRRIDELNAQLGDKIEIRRYYIDVFGDVAKNIDTGWQQRGGYEGFAEHVEQVRGVLKSKGIKISVVKNQMMRRALDTLDLAAAASLFAAGPCTVAYGGDSVVDVAKELADWAKKLDAVEIRGAFVDGKAVDASGAKSLAKMKSRAELQGDIVMLANSPGSNLAGAIAGPGGVIAGCIESLIEKLEEAA